MKKFRIALPLAAAAVAAAVAASAAPAAVAKTVPFSASYAGRAIVRVSGDTADITATGKGTGTLVGKSALAGKGTGANSDPCPVFWGPGTITAADKSVLKFRVLPGAKVCKGAVDENKNDVSGTIAVKGGTGKYAKAKGTLKLSGIYDRGTGLFSIKLVGKLTV